MQSRVGVFVADDHVMLRCDVCACSCQVPAELTATDALEFFRQHPADVDAALHPAEPPAWSVDTAPS